MPYPSANSGGLNRRNNMRKSKTINFSTIVVVLLFLLTQSTFSITAGLTQEDLTLVQTETSQIPNPSQDYDIDTDGNKVLFTADDTAKSVRIAALDAAAPFLMASTLSVASEETSNEQNAQASVKEIKSIVRYVNADKLNVREEASSESKLVATISRGDKVTYYETIGEWARIITWQDKKGYILAKHLVNTEKEVKKVTAVVSRGTTEKTAVSQPATAEQLSLTEKIVNYAKSLQGVKYVYGGYSTSGFDCSGFTKYVFAKYDIRVPRSSASYSGIGTKIARSDLRAGDILLFDTDGGTADVSHVGIYVGGGNFIHASTSKGKVIVMNLDSYRGKYMGARRVIK